MRLNTLISIMKMKLWLMDYTYILRLGLLTSQIKCLLKADHCSNMFQYSIKLDKFCLDSHKCCLNHHFLREQRNRPL